MKPMSKGFYIGGYFAGIGMTMVLAFVFVIMLVVFAAQHPNNNEDPPPALFGFLALAILPMLFSIVVHFMFVYRMWAGIQDGQPRMTPGIAVGFLFIPLFNLYWMFQVYQGFAQDYNKYIAWRQLNLPRLDEQLFLYYPIAILCSIIPILGSLASLVAIVLLVMIMIKTCDAVNALNNAPRLPAAAPTAAGI